MEEYGVRSFDLLRRHESGDWGDVCPKDAEANENDLRDGERLLSRYNFAGEVGVYIITEWDRSLTTVLCPEEY